MACRLFYRLSHVIFTVELENVGDQIQSMLIVVNLSLQTSEIEAICEVFLVNLAKILVASRRNELSENVSRCPNELISRT